ncbi:MAG: hypothetical protein JNG84_12715 [Archangium sp.]|nr:hypothetical protein [Archangium sp.]
MIPLTRAELEAHLGPALTELGYTTFPSSFDDAPGVFAKRVGGGLVLTLGLTRSDDGTRFTGSYFLSKSTRWGAVWGDIPVESLERVAARLTGDERRRLLESEYHSEAVRDGWWDGRAESSGRSFSTAVALTESRFLAQADLALRVQKSVELHELAESAWAVSELVKRPQGPGPFPYRFTPGRAVDRVGREWFQAAERVLVERGAPSSKTVTALALDAWRLQQLGAGRP